LLLPSIEQGESNSDYDSSEDASFSSNTADAEDMILASIPRHILELPRPEFNQWKKDNSIKFRGEEQNALTRVRRRMLACKYAREARIRKTRGRVGGVRFGS
jgi:hypothetical protein